MQTVIAAVAAALASGFLGAWLGAWIQSRHDRRERLRARRIDAADDLVAAASDALLKVSSAIDLLELGKDEEAEALGLNDDMTAVVGKSSRFDLLFVVGSPACNNGNRIISELRHAIDAGRRGAIQEARRYHSAASEAMSWLTLAASDTIRITGTRKDPFKALRTLKDEPEIEPMNRDAVAKGD